MKMSNNKRSKCNTKFDNTYPLYKSIEIITQRKHYEKKKKWQVIKVVTVTLDLMTLAIQVQYRYILISH